MSGFTCSEQSRISLRVRYAEARKSAALMVKIPKCNLGKISNLITVTGKATKVLWQTIQHLRCKNLIFLDPSNTKTVSYSTMRRTSLADGESIPKTFWTHLPTIGDTWDTFGTGKYYHCNRSFPTCQNTENSWRPRCNPIWNAQKPWTEKEFFGSLVCVKWPGVRERHRKIGKLRWSSPYTRRETGKNQKKSVASLSLASLEKGNVCACFVDLEKAYGRVSPEKVWGVLREYSVG